MQLSIPLTIERTGSTIGNSAPDSSPGRKFNRSTRSALQLPDIIDRPTILLPALPVAESKSSHYNVTKQFDASLGNIQFLLDPDPIESQLHHRQQGRSSAAANLLDRINQLQLDVSRPTVSLSNTFDHWTATGEDGRDPQGSVVAQGKTYNDISHFEDTDFKDYVRHVHVSVHAKDNTNYEEIAGIKGVCDDICRVSLKLAIKREESFLELRIHIDKDDWEEGCNC
ncbi:MAG: hypothetical protein Q9223_005692 [Gallowayella weberi]